MDNRDSLFNELYVTITGFDNYFGKEVFEIGQTLIMVKEPGNKYDTEAIAVHGALIGKVGYVANSPYTTARGCLSAGRIYDFIEQECAAVVRFMTEKKVIARVFPEIILDINVDMTETAELTDEEKLIQEYLERLKDTENLS